QTLEVAELPGVEQLLNLQGDRLADAGNRPQPSLGRQHVEIFGQTLDLPRGVPIRVDPKAGLAFDLQQIPKRVENPHDFFVAHLISYIRFSRATLLSQRPLSLTVRC